MNRLITIHHSHYCEKARWALERANVPFREEPHAPGLSAGFAWKAGGRLTVPVLILADGTVYADSSEIVDYADSLTPEEDRLFRPPLSAEAEELLPLFNERLGPDARRVTYHHALQQIDLMMPLMLPRLPWYERVTAPLSRPVLSLMLKRRLSITPERVEQSYRSVEQIFHRVGELLGDDREFLGGDRFSGLDLTFCALASLVVLPPEYPGDFPPLAKLSDNWREMVCHFRDYRAGRFCLKVYREQRTRRLVPQPA